MEEFNAISPKPLTVYEMTLNYPYLVEEIYRCKTRFGEKLIIATEGHITYLPQRYNRKLSDDAIKEINNNQYVLIKTYGSKKNCDLKLKKYCKYQMIIHNN